MIKKLISKYKARSLEAKVTAMKQQQEVEYANYALKLRMEKLLTEGVGSRAAA